MTEKANRRVECVFLCDLLLIFDVRFQGLKYVLFSNIFGVGTSRRYFGMAQAVRNGSGKTMMRIIGQEFGA